MSNAELIAPIQRVQRELVEMKAYQQGYLERRSRAGIGTNTDSIMARQQKTLAETLELLEAYKAEKEGEPDE